MLPLDTHAHLVPRITPVQLNELRSHVVAVTRSIDEFQSVLDRDDATTVWALGCHPGLVKVQRGFSVTQFSELLAKAALIGEVGLDGESRVPLEQQREVFRSVLAAAQEQPRVMTVHSYHATAQVLEDLRGFPGTAAILHWWLGEVAETRLALSTGCYFSFNASSVRRKEILKEIPLNRVLTETDHPFGDRWSSPPRRPGAVEDVEKALAKHYSISAQAIRERIWRNFSDVLSRSKSTSLLPRGFRDQLEAATGDGEKGGPRLFH